MITTVFGMVLPWLLVAVGGWLGYQLIRQNGRILLRLEAIEKHLKARPGAKATLAHTKHTDPSLAKSRLNRNGLKAGAIAPDFRLPRIDEGELSLAELRGRRVLLVFSDPNCGPCDELAPQLEQLHRKRPDLQIVMVSRRDAEATRTKAASLELSFPIVMQNQWEISLKYAMFATPIGYLIDERGIILKDVAVGAGPIRALAEEPAISPTKAAETSLLTTSQT